ncbi:hypothetical protein GCM10014715_84150 [Streptomyces spiralis]|uniref:Uncharacterized protein n=1 Tax=Streptomyces spiralis TaxID=66376 RepID=A0A919AM17_9ACTN|nr:hypothetical protein GCM10014715_84150 [Streptomyces spiralis]
MPMNDGFCQVGNRPPNPGSATPARPAVTAARWMGGSHRQEAASTAGPPAPSVGPSAGVVRGDGDAPSPPSLVRLRSRSRKATAQPSASARVTRDAICSV